MWWLVPAAFLLDLLLADPRWLPHPVQGIGWLASKLEAPAGKSPHPVLAGGAALGLLLLIADTAAALLISLPSFWGAVAALYLAWSGLALGGLVREGKAALVLLTEAERLSLAGDREGSARTLAQARHAVRMLVSRDTATMDARDLCRSLAESVSENFNDAFAAPLFWLCLGGPVGLWLYKTASTMDSMWGYKNDRWLYLGRASARLDDLLAYIPARISALLLFAAARLKNRLDGSVAAPPDSASSARLFFSNVLRDARQCDSPNAGWPMAAAAWLLDGRSGGPTPYHGKLVDKPYLGPDHGQWTTDKTAALLRLVFRAGVLGGLVGTGIVWVCAV